MFFNDFFCVVKYIKRLSINVVKYVVIRFFILYFVEIFIGLVWLRMIIILDLVLVFVGWCLCLGVGEIFGGVYFFVSG